MVDVYFINHLAKSWVNCQNVMGAERNIVFKLRTYEKIYKIKGIKLALLSVIIFKGIYDFGNAHTSILSIYSKL